MTEPMSEERLREIEARVAARPHGSALWDDHCEWLYDVASFAPALLAEISRLRKELDEAKAAAKVMADCHAHLDSEARAERAEKHNAQLRADLEWYRQRVGERPDATTKHGAKDAC